jgi:L-alanine-DL-glutamate epimerase-like enolase superfamily enzyme
MTRENAMKITRVDVLLTEPVPQQSAIWHPVLCRVHTDARFYGDGEAALSYGIGGRAAYGVVQDYAKLLIGLNPLDTEVIWEKLYKSTFWAQNGGPTEFAGISALDMALWDIKGKHFNVPVSTLLGGKFRSRLRAYASQLHFGWGPVKQAAASVDDYVQYAQKAVAEGYDAIKIDFFIFDEDGHRLSSEETTRLQAPKYKNMVIRRLAAVRKAVGPDVDIIMENHAYTDAQTAVQLARLAEPYDIFYFEEPCASNVRATKFVRDHINLPVSQGERVYSRWEYLPLLEAGAVQLIQPDIGTCGGISEAKKICDLAHIYDVGVQAHVCGSPLSTAAALQLEAAIPNFTIHEHHVYNLYDHNKKLCVHDLQPVNGYFEVPERPGLGNEIAPYAFEQAQITTIS